MDLNKALATFGLDPIKPQSEQTTESLVKGVSEKELDGKTIYVIDRLDKGKLFYNINDVLADFFVEKTGKDVKAKIQAIKTIDDTEAAGHILAANECLKNCTIKPTSDDCIGDYELRGTKIKFGTIPMMFNWDEVYAFDKQNEVSLQTVDTYGQKVAMKKVENPYRMYNQHIRMYVECRVESIILDTVINNMDEKKKYKLTAEQASKLGF